MPELEVEGVGTFEVEVGKRLVLAIEEDGRVDIMHACGSYAKHGTCRVEFLGGRARVHDRGRDEPRYARSARGG